MAQNAQSKKENSTPKWVTSVNMICESKPAEPLPAPRSRAKAGGKRVGVRRKKRAQNRLGS